MFYRYIIKFDSGEERTIELHLDPATLSIVPRKNAYLPEWTLLDFEKCSVCPYPAAPGKHCPIAMNLAEVTNIFSDKSSIMKVDVRVITEAREYFKRTSLQTALSSLIGIYMATSGCKVMDMLKPMARYHLPFASLGETTHRSVSSYLLLQYLRKKKGLKPDWDLAKLKKAYKTIEELNVAIVNRVRKASKKDANSNAVIILDVFAKMVPWTITKGLTAKRLQMPE
ncbi:MAG: hypothetical protein WCK76_03575 [Elusimicrobiota bacterium]